MQTVVEQDDVNRFIRQSQCQFTVNRRIPRNLRCGVKSDRRHPLQSSRDRLPVTDDELALSGSRLMRSLCALTPDDLSVQALFCAPAGFSARFDALSRSYRYRIAASQARPVLAWDHSWWYRGSLDVDAMAEAARPLIGEHDFKSFCKASSAEGKPTCRYVGRLDVSRVTEAGEELVAIDVTGNAFLHNMVRTIAGSLVEVGRGHRPVEWLEKVLEARERTAAGPCAPAKGLTFVGVEYPELTLTPWE